MTQDVRMIALDLDGTALDSEKQLSPAVAGAIARALRAGVVVLPATGRSLSGLPQALLGIPGLRYAICANGAELYDLRDGSILYSDYFDKKTALSILDDCDKLGVYAAVLMEGRIYAQWTDFDSLNGQYPEATLHYLKASRLPVKNLAEKIGASAAPVAKFTMVFPDMAVRPRAIAHFTARGDCTVTASLGTNLELNTATANKGAALLALAARLGIPRGQVMAVGDGLNDVEMLRAAGVAVAMGNCVPELRGVAGHVTRSCDEDGVAAAIDRVLG